MVFPASASGGDLSALLTYLLTAAALGFPLLLPVDLKAARIARFAVLPRRLAPGCRLWQYFRAPERPDSRRGNLAGS